MKKNILIVTYYNACNYGAFLQAYALKKYIHQQNMNVDIFGIELDNQINIEENKENFYEQLNRKLIDCQEKLPVVWNIKEDYDVAIIGSDEVFNFSNVTYRNCLCFDGTNLPAKKIISYAASIGGARYRKLILNNFFRIKKLGKLDAISVRDIRTEKLVKRFTKQNVNRSVDPTLLVDFDDEIVLPDYDDFVLVYTYGMKKEHIDFIIDYAHKRNLKIVGTGSYCEWCDINVPVNPFEWLGLIKKSQFVFTSTFHGTIFAIKYRKEFVALVDYSEKVKSLLKDFGLSDRHCTTKEMNRLEQVCNSKIDYSNLPVEKLINDSKRYLLKELQ